MNFALTRNEWISKALAMLIAIVCFAANFYYNNARLIFLSCIALCCILMIRAARHKYLFLIFCFIGSYVVLLSPYFLSNLSIGTFSVLERADTYQKTIYIFSVFLTSLLFFFKEMPEVPLVQRLPVYDNNVIFAINTVVTLSILIFGAKGQTILEAGYGRNQGSISVIYMYFPIFFIASYLFSGRKPLKVYLTILIGLAFIAKSLLFGGRASTISILLVVYILFFDSKISFPVLLLLIFLGFTFFNFWGQFRAGPNLSTLNISELFDLGIKYKDKYTAVGNNQTDVFYASVRIITMVDIGLIDTLKRIQAFGLFCISAFVPYSMLPPLANLSTYNLGTYNSLGGGLIFAYFYTYLSYFGVVLIGFVLNKIWDVLRTSSGRYTLMYCILALATINGWFAYHPITLFKLCVWGVFYLAALDVLNSWLARKRV